MRLGLALATLSLALSACSARPPSEPHAGRFEDPAKWSKVWDAQTRDAWQRPDELVALLSLRPGMTVADVGAGTGYLEPYLARAVGPSGKVLALDIEPTMVAWMRDRFVREKLGNVRAILCTEGDPLLDEESVDRVVLVDTYHHLQDRVLYLQRLASAVRVGGAVFVVDFTLQSTMGPPPKHRVAADVVRAELAGAGFDATILGESLPEQYVVVGWRSH